MWPIMLIISILTSIYLIYLSVQNLGRRAFWRGLVYTAVLYLYSFGYVMLHNVGQLLPPKGESLARQYRAKTCYVT